MREPVGRHPLEESQDKARMTQGTTLPRPKGRPPTPMREPPNSGKTGTTHSLRTGKSIVKPGTRAPKYILTPAEITSRIAKASRRAQQRSSRKRTLQQPTLLDYWPTFVPDSLPIRTQSGPRSSLLPNSLHNMGWKPDRLSSSVRTYTGRHPFPFTTLLLAHHNQRTTARPQ